MINKHEFQMSAKAFRAGRLSLEQFTAKVFSTDPSRQSGSSDSPPLLHLPPRTAESHKGDFGKVVLIGGSLGMAGAITLAGQAALRSGAGLVRLVVPDTIQATVAVGSTCYMTLACESAEGAFSQTSISAIQEAAKWGDVVAVGPGMGRGSALTSIVTQLYRDLPQALIIDADGINALAEGEVDLADHAGPRVLTPHEGEFQRLLGKKVNDRTLGQKQSRTILEQVAVDLAKRAEIIVVLKGNHTFISNGNDSYHNITGNPGLATGGTGDVLTGVIAAVLGQTIRMGQGMELLDAVRLAVYNHSWAGDLATKEKGEVSMIASDLIDHLSTTFKSNS